MYVVDKMTSDVDHARCSGEGESELKVDSGENNPGQSEEG